ncbi:hypothetical protein [Mangrovimonas aestuarii]|uniref:hypothetical protein n=1 Tax=Mangrovimonas aestuarii TaxID=3018443 RepID=UPI002379F71F|nr:hypothetical protein [Mangrovimonas aestuarii]
MSLTYIHTALTRTTNLNTVPFQVTKLEQQHWNMADFIACEILDTGHANAQLELTNGRMRGIMSGEILIGALGDRHATLEATGSWKTIEQDGIMHALTAGGLLGKLTSKSSFKPAFPKIKYLGHITRNGNKLTMDDFIVPKPDKTYNTPTVLFIGTSMSAGKTTSARIVTGLLKQKGLKVVGAKITGAGRYKDILAIKDIGADAVYDFVDAGLPSSIAPSDIYKKKLQYMMNCVSNESADIAVIEIGASPLEPYNGDLAYQAIKKHVKCTILSASDPYSVYGLMEAFDLKPDIVTGISTNTLGGRELVEKLCGVTALNLIEAESIPTLKSILRQRLGISV